MVSKVLNRPALVLNRNWQAKMRLKHKPVQPKWNPLYAAHDLRIESWSKFLSEAYWNVELKT